ncbi:hypothetical protein fugu_008427 [Takifugu bimaculatus]|uniref:Uncharacterized protein n=1 Tax=Takifugu bimaculatus TaxID=433685 RepID=A0A4Z2B3H3_9TELE|nr:hypothetical protein fugu_008427 [Takifugu bimaculatus]
MNDCQMNRGTFHTAAFMRRLIRSESFMFSHEQDRLRLQLIQEDSEDWQSRTHFLGLERVAGVDLSYIKGDHVHACAQLVVLSYPELQVREREIRVFECGFLGPAGPGGS